MKKILAIALILVMSPLFSREKADLRSVVKQAGKINEVNKPACPATPKQQNAMNICLSSLEQNLTSNGRPAQIASIRNTKDFKVQVSKLNALAIEVGQTYKRDQDELIKYLRQPEFGLPISMKYEYKQIFGPCTDVDKSISKTVKEQLKPLK